VYIRSVAILAASFGFDKLKKYIYIVVEGASAVDAPLREAPSRQS